MPEPASQRPAPRQVGADKVLSLASMVLPNMKKMLLLSVLVMGLGLLIPALFLLLLGHGVGDVLGDQAEVGMLFLVVGGAVGISAVTELLMARLGIVTATAASIRYVPAMFTALLRKKYPFFEKRALADINQRFSSMSQAMAARASLLTMMRVSIISCASAIAIMFWIHVLLGSLAIAVIVLYGLVSLYYAQPRTALMKQLEEASALKDELVFETIDGIGTVKSAQMHHERGLSFAQRHMQAMTIGNRLNMMDAKQTILYKMFSNIESVVLLAISITLFAKQELTVGALFAFSLFKQIASGAATSFYLSSIAYKEQKVVDLRARAMMAYPEDAPYTAEMSIHHTLAISAVDFAYEQSPLLYCNVQFSIAKGEKVAIIGHSGGGKSTLLKLLSGLYSPAAGTLTIDGQSVDWAVLSALTFYLQPNDVLFHASVKDNITLFKHPVDTELVDKVVDALGLRPCIEQLPHGWKTPVSQTNPLMSSGQRQRVLVARALCSGKALLMLDEPTANLDSHSARHVMDAILASDKTVLVVLHEPELLAGFDRVIQIVDGQLVDIPAPSSREGESGGAGGLPTAVVGRGDDVC